MALWEGGLSCLSCLSWASEKGGSGWSLNARPVLVVVFGVGLFVPPEHMMESIRSLRRK